MKYFLTFGADSSYYEQAIQRITKQAHKLQLFNHIISLNENDLKRDEKFWKEHGSFIEENKRGYGYWIWKPYLIWKQLELMEENDILLYLDCGCEINFYAKERMMSYFDLVKEKHLLVTSTDLPEKVWTKRDLFERLEMNPFDDTEQIQSGILLLIKNKNTLNLIKEWYQIACYYPNIDDSPSILPNHSDFREHRHDQSVLSLLCKKYNYVNTDLNPTWFGKRTYKYKIIEGYPIIANRNRSSLSKFYQLRC